PGTNLSLTAPSGEKPPFIAVRDGKEVPVEELPMQYAAAHGVDVRGTEIEHVHADGTSYSLYGSAAPLFDGDGKVRGCVAAFLDITERKRLLEDLQQRVEEAAVMDRRKDEFLAMLAHELRNPLAPIANAVQVLRLLGHSEPARQEAWDMIDRQVQHLTRLV